MKYCSSAQYERYVDCIHTGHNTAQQKWLAARAVCILRVSVLLPRKDTTAVVIIAVFTPIAAIYTYYPTITICLILTSYHLTLPRSVCPYTHHLTLTLTLALALTPLYLSLALPVISPSPTPALLSPRSELSANQLPDEVAKLGKSSRPSRHYSMEAEY
jgi:hypothetical protein